ncbi:hypothetical protein [Psychrobacillus sp. MER TA 171]|uniref:hypothetical protein n=1 Tax=Psychrobacillus sp. MER TA 171 TaxID=2939577 RepID=UPI002041078D|nr:hypothetical protein [Psychrobacillus sp. MER TA 171]MCM3358068.1 hypothetical protein [Psychrobacillus sp. MER TA 171]
MTNYSKELTQKTVALTLATMNFKVTGESNEEFLENAKKALVEQLNTGIFPHITYGVYEDNVLTFDTAFPGQIVEATDGKLGIITAINKETINVTLKNGISVQGPPAAFKSSTATFEEARSKRNELDKQNNYWFEGYSAYIKTAQGVKEVVVGKFARGIAKLHVINSNSFIPLSEREMHKHLKDEKS